MNEPFASTTHHTVESCWIAQVEVVDQVGQALHVPRLVHPPHRRAACETTRQDAPISHA
jgi:hypothetical protein